MGYGSMCVEVVLGIVALIIVCAAASNGVLPAGTPFQTFSGSVAGFLTDIFGVPTDIAACILTMCVSALALTSVDAVARIGRMSLQELFTPGPGEAMGPIQKLFTNTVFATILTLAMGYALCLAVFLKATGRKGWMLYGPMTVMFVVTMTALIQACLRIFRSMADGTFVFMVGGLQLIIAVALIILALLVVYHCVMKLREPSPAADAAAKQA